MMVSVGHLCVSLCVPMHQRRNLGTLKLHTKMAVCQKKESLQHSACYPLVCATDAWLIYGMLQSDHTDVLEEIHSWISRNLFKLIIDGSHGEMQGEGAIWVREVALWG